MEISQRKRTAKTWNRGTRNQHKKYRESIVFRVKRKSSAEPDIERRWRHRRITPFIKNLSDYTTLVRYIPRPPHAYAPKDGIYDLCNSDGFPINISLFLFRVENLRTSYLVHPKKHIFLLFVQRTVSYCLKYKQCHNSVFQTAKGKHDREKTFPILFDYIFCSFCIWLFPSRLHHLILFTIPILLFWSFVFGFSLILHAS